MSRAIGKHISDINKQRQILSDWSAYEVDLDRFFDDGLKATYSAMTAAGPITAPTHMTAYSADDFLAQYAYNLDVAETRLKTAASTGSAVDISETSLGHDICCIVDPRNTGTALGNRLRIRRNLARMDFFERFGRLVELETFKLTIPRITPPKPNRPIADLALALQIVVYDPVVLLSFADKSDAMLYRLAI